jgi:hypothetical protein
MKNRSEALRRLGAPFCGACSSIVDDDGADGPSRFVSILQSDVPVFRAEFGDVPRSRAGVLMCGSCQVRLSKAIETETLRGIKARIEARSRELRNVYENARDTARLIEPNSRSYADEVRRHRSEIREAMRLNGGLGLFGGGED